MPSPDHRPSHVRIRFVDEDVAATARLLWDEAPEICQTVIDAAPMTVRAHHAIFSGSEIAAITPNLPALELTSPTSQVDVGDLAYTYLCASDHSGVDDDFAEVCWFYDNDATPSMASGPVDVSVFARFENAESFFAASRRMRLEGAKIIEVSTESG